MFLSRLVQTFCVLFVMVGVEGLLAQRPTVVRSGRDTTESPPEHTFRSRREVMRDAAVRFATTTEKAMAPSTRNWTQTEGNVTINYGFAFRMTAPELDEIRYECGNDAVNLGCDVLEGWDYILVYGHLHASFACVHDPPCSVAVPNLIYRYRNGAWSLLTK